MSPPSLDFLPKQLKTIVATLLAISAIVYASVDITSRFTGWVEGKAIAAALPAVTEATKIRTVLTLINAKLDTLNTRAALTQQLLENHLEAKAP